MEKLTPMMRQYLEIKEQYKDCILFFRLGDFYEMFFEDAEIVSRELEITLTGRDCGLEERAPMCGVPFHSVNPYISKLINKGYKVAICEQMEDPALAKGIVKREVVRVITPGTVTELSMLDEKKNNFLLSVFSSKDLYGIAAVDITTGEFLTTRIIWGNTFSKLLDEIAKYSPSEIIVNTELFNDISKKNEIVARFNTYINRLDDEYFRLDNSIEKVNYYFDDKKIEELSVNACGALLSYLEQTQKVNLTHIREIKSYQIEEYMSLDVATRWHLELTETMRDKTRKGSLIWVMDKTVTSMGGRTLRKWLEQPLIKVADIEERLEAVSELKDKYMVRMEIREYLKKVYDIERLMSKVIIGNVNCRDLISLKESISQIPSIKSLLKNCTAQLNVKNYQGLHTLQDINVLIEKSIIDDPPVTVKEGGIIKAEYNEELAKLRQAATDGKKWIAELEALEKEKTGIKNLKVGFNKVFGYYIEVTKSYYSLVPDNYIRKQTLANCERYITQELKELEETILYAEEKSVELEYKIFTEIKDEIASHVGRIKTTASCLSEIDVICSLAELADRENYCMPEVDESGVIIIEEGRHPVVEKMMTSGSFVPNDTCLDNDENRIAIITGPNMAGKSTYMRQVALIVLMAQIGSF
ncbi:MAG: DNA mismatch repair protein MutS, partial [Clostridiaceae bacterium]|nr:DNA mismatch repair protein MutS [Clostridiaceae bacterium]